MTDDSLSPMTTTTPVTPSPPREQHSTNGNTNGSTNTRPDPSMGAVQMLASIHHNAKGGTYHPDFMFCGECTSCNDHAVVTEPMPQGLEIINKDLQKQSPESEIRTKLELENFDCPSQVLLIKSVLMPLPGVTKVMPSLERGHVLVDHDAQTTEQHLRDNLQQVGFACKLDSEQGGGATKSTLCRSQLHVRGICCASECPSIHKILRRLPGVSKVQINITTKMVYVHHDAAIVSAQECADALNREAFGAKVHKDGGADATPSKHELLPLHVGRTTLHLQKVITNKDVTNCQVLLTKLPGVKRIGVNVLECVLYVEHDVTEISASRIQQVLQDQDYPTELATDARQDIEERQTSALQVARSKYVESTLVVTNLTLQHVSLVNKAFHQNYIRAQIRAFYPNVPSKTIKVEHNASLVDIASVATTLHRYGLEASVAVDGSVENLCLPLMEDYHHDDDDDDDENGIYSGSSSSISSSRNGTKEEAAVNRMHWNVALSGFFWFLSILSVIGGNWQYLKYCGLCSVLFGLPPIAIKAWRTLRRCQFDANCMMVTAAVGALCLGEFDEAASVAFLFAVSEYLEARATRKARRALASIVSLKPDHANVVHPVTKELVVVPADKVPVGSCVSVRTGDKICADGVVVEGTSTVDESSLTGEALPVRKGPQDVVSGGSINIGTTQLVVQTTSSVQDSAVSRLIRLVEEAQANRSPTEKLIDSFAKAYTPIVVLLAACMCTIPWAFGRDTGRYWTLNGLIIIVIACPCALTISTPVTYSAGLAATAQRGVIVKGGSRLEALGSVDKVIFDKTGTLTQGNFQVMHLDNIGEQYTRKQVLELLALMEAPSSHPLSATLVTAAKKEGFGIPKDATVTDHSILKGEGVTAVVNGKQVYVGNRRLFRRVGMLHTLPLPNKAAAEEWNRNGGTVGFIGIEGDGIIGAFCVTDAVREEARDVVSSLHDGNIQVIMLTGDGDGAAKAVAKQVGILESNVHSQLLPEDKLHFVGSLKTTTSSNGRCSMCRKKSHVLMVGDGVNDAPALAVADVGVAMGEGAALAMEMSDITLMDSNLSKLLYTIKMGARVIVTIQENIFISVVSKLLVVGLTFAGKMTLLTAIAADVGIMLVVTLNGMKLLPSKREKNKSLKKERAKRLHAEYNELPLDGSSARATGTAGAEIEIV